MVGDIAVTLIIAAPYLLALLASRSRNSGVRGGLLAALGLLSLVATLSAFSLVILVLLPATFVLWFAAARSLAASTRLLTTALPAAVAGLLIAAVVVLGYFAVFAIQDDKPQCWVVSDDSGGQFERVTPVNTGQAGGLSAGMLTVGQNSFCTSDTVTGVEAAMGIGAVLVALLSMLFICPLRPPAARPSDLRAPPR